MKFDSKERIPVVNSMKILLVGDGSGSLGRIHQLLSESDLASCYLDCVTTPIETADRFRENSHDVCIIDSIELKAGDFMARAKSLGCSVPVIVVTSDSSADILDAIHAGVADCLLRDQLTRSLLEESICRVIQEARLALDRLENERRYSGLIENAKDIIYTHDLQGNYKSANKAAEGLTGYTQEELLRMNATQLVAKEYVHLSREMVEWKLESQSQQKTSYELELLTKDGRRVPVEINSHLIYREGRPVAVQGIARDITQRRLFEAALRDSDEALRRSEEEYREIFDNATMGIYRSSREGRLVRANRALARILGYSSVAELLQCNLTTDIYSAPDERARLIAQGLPSGAEVLEVLWKKKNGSPIWIQLNAIAIKDESGNTVFFDGFVHEISERKEAETALRESEERYQRLVELSPDGIFVHTDGHITFANSSAVRLIGAPSAKSIIGKSVYDFIDASQHLRLTERVTKLQNGEFVSPMELKGRRFDGSEVECEVLSVPLMLNEKRSVQVVIRDITERKHAEQALDEANKRALADYDRLVERMAVLGQSLSNARDLKAILRAVRDFTIVSVPCDGMVITLYEAEKALRRGVYCWADGAEVETDDLLEFPVGDGMTGQALKTGLILIENNFQESLVHSYQSVIGSVEEGSIPRSALSAPMTVMGRTVGCVEIQSYDLNAYREEHKTAMRMAANLAANAVENVALMEREQDQADQLRQSQKMEAIGQLAGGVAHDFNNLLTAISGYSELGLRRLNNNDPLRKNLEEISKASSRATSLTRQLLAFSRKQMLQAKVIDINEIVDDMDKMLRRLIGEDIDLITLLDPSSCQVKADQGQIEQVILNLAVNARDAMPVGGKLTIETGRVYVAETHGRPHDAVQSGTYVMLSVSDTGAGIIPEIQKRVFEPFFTTKEVGKGTGLGLSTVYGIVKQSGGNISVDSEPGKGSTFKVFLPVVSEPADSGDAQSNLSELHPGRETVLVVEDEEMVRNLSCEILEMNGYRVLAAANGEEACRVCEVHRGEIHLMITDVVMPQMSGREVAEHVAKTRPDMKVLYMSGYTDDAVVSHGVLDDRIPFLQKPFTPDSFARKVRELLEQVPLARA
jgi:PAS domain S-box-containing protein